MHSKLMKEFGEGRQFRGPRTRRGKRIRNRVGNCYWLRKEVVSSRPRVRVQIDELNDLSDVCPFAEEPARGSRVISLPETGVTLRYAKDGTLASASAA